MASSATTADFLANYETHTWSQSADYLKKCDCCGLTVITNKCSVNFRVVRLPPCPAKKAEDSNG